MERFNLAYLFSQLNIILVYMTLILGDCLIELKKIDDKSVDMVYLDLPFGCTACKWDVKLDLKALWVELKRVARSERTGFFFSCTTKFGFELFNNSPKGYFRWDLVWEKNRAAGFLNAYRLPMRKHEMIYCFAKKTPAYDVSSHSEFVYDNRTYQEIKSAEIYGKAKGNTPLMHGGKNQGKLFNERLPTSVLPPQEDHELIYCFAKKTPAYDVSNHSEFVYDNRTYQELKSADIYGKAKGNTPLLVGSSGTGGKTHKDKLPTSVLPPQEDHELIYCFAKKTPAYDVSSHNEVTETSYNKMNGKGQSGVYQEQEGTSVKTTHTERLPTSVLPTEVRENTIYQKHENEPDRYEKQAKRNGKLPTSVLPQEDTPSSWCKYDVDGKTKHRTSKPVKLMEFLLKYWSKEGDTILDPTFGSGAMAVACQNMKRKFIGIEMCAEFHELATERLKDNAIRLESLSGE